MENFFLGLELLRSLGFWKGAEETYPPKWDDGFLYVPCYFRACSPETAITLGSLGFSWNITGMLRYPIEQGRLI